MRSFVLSFVAVLALAACNANKPQEKPAAPAAAPPVAAPAPAPAPVEAAAPKRDPLPPEGTCGDQGAVAKDQRLSNTPRWTTASEVDNFGYDVFRGELEAGPFVKLTESPILGAGTTDETSKYEYRDENIDPCKDYWYYVEAISTTGAREKFTPVFRAPAKRRAVGSKPATDI